jgi:hypothetical protein
VERQTDEEAWLSDAPLNVKMSYEEEEEEVISKLSLVSFWNTAHHQLAISSQMIASSLYIPLCEHFQY